MPSCLLIICAILLVTSLCINGSDGAPSEKVHKAGEVDKPEKTEKAEKTGKAHKSGAAEETDITEKTEKAADKTGKTEKKEKAGKKEKTAEKQEKVPDVRSRRYSMKVEFFFEATHIDLRVDNDATKEKWPVFLSTLLSHLQNKMAVQTFIEENKGVNETSTNLRLGELLDFSEEMTYLTTSQVMQQCDFYSASKEGKSSVIPKLPSVAEQAKAKVLLTGQEIPFVSINPKKDRVVELDLQSPTSTESIRSFVDEEINAHAAEDGTRRSQSTIEVDAPYHLLIDCQRYIRMAPTFKQIDADSPYFANDDDDEEDEEANKNENNEMDGTQTNEEEENPEGEEKIGGGGEEEENEEDIDADNDEASSKDSSSYKKENAFFVVEHFASTSLPQVTIYQPHSNKDFENKDITYIEMLGKNKDAPKQGFGEMKDVIATQIENEGFGKKVDINEVCDIYILIFAYKVNRNVVKEFASAKEEECLKNNSEFETAARGGVDRRSLGKSPKKKGASAYRVYTNMLTVWIKLIEDEDEETIYKKKYTKLSNRIFLNCEEPVLHMERRQHFWKKKHHEEKPEVQ